MGLPMAVMLGIRRAGQKWSASIQDIMFGDAWKVASTIFFNRRE
jgi:hypothetical protein